MIKYFLPICIMIFTSFVDAAPGTGLQTEGWNPEVRKKLELIIQEGAGKGLPVVFDLDETLLARDIADATFGILVRDKYLTKEKIPKVLSPALNFKGSILSLDNATDLCEYGEWLLESTRHQEGDLSPNLCFFQWVVQIMAGLTCDQVIEATAKAYDNGAGIEDESSYPGDKKIWITGQKTSYLRPFFRPQMVELIGAFLEHGYDVWVISATNVLMARWMAAKALNDLLRSQGYSKTVLPEHVIGIASLVQDDKGILYKDYPLIKTDPGYLNMEKQALGRYTLTALMSPPISGYSGKVAAMIERIGPTPYFGAGDSLSDHPFLKMCRHKLWIAKLEYPQLQEAAIESISQTPAGSWLVQPVLTKKSPCMVPSLQHVNKALQDDPLLKEAHRSIELLQKSKLLVLPIN